MWNALALTVPSAIVVYVIAVRPMLRELPEFKALYAEADGFWRKAWAVCGKSRLIAGSFIVQAVGWSLDMLDPIAALLGDPDLHGQITDALGANPKALAIVLKIISAIIIAARMRSLFKGA